MILFVFCCKKYHKSIILGWFFWAFSAFSQSSALSFLYQMLHSIGETFVDQLRHVCQFSSESNQAAYFQRWTDLLFQKVDNLGGRIDVHPCRFSSLCFLWMLIGNRNDSVPNKSYYLGIRCPAMLAAYARGLFCWCPLVVQRMPIRWSIRDHVVGTNFFNLFNFPFAKVGLMIDYLNNVE